MQRSRTGITGVIVALSCLLASTAWAGLPPELERLRKSRSLEELLTALYAAPAPLEVGERELVTRALELTPPERAELRARLQSRLALAALASPRKHSKEPIASRAELMSSRPYASPFRVAALLPDRGDYADYGAQVRGGLAAGLATSQVPLDLWSCGTGDDDAPRAAAALDSAAKRCAIVVGELLSVPTRALATASRFMGLPLVSPSATDESIGRIGPAVFQVGPASRERAQVLANSVLAGKARRVAVVASSRAMDSEFVRSFVAEAESLAGRIVRRDAYASGALEFRSTARAVKASGAEVLLWDGESREAEALVRALAAEGVSVRICGGEALAPEQFHAGARTWFEGVTYVAEDWKLTAPQQAWLDSLARGAGSKAGPLWTRGFLAGRRIAAAIDAGARAPGELAAALRHRESTMREAGMLEVTFEGARLPVYGVQRGKAVELTSRKD